MAWVGLAVGSVAGGLARYFITGFVHRIGGIGFPYGTLAVNLLGCFVVGILEGFSETRFALSNNARLFLMTGFCGAFTTFSTLILETSRLTQEGELVKAAINLSASVAAGVLIFYIGVLVARAL